MGVVSIIGHGPSPVGKGWGPRIDLTTVVRLKDPAWQVSRKADYGTRCDYICASAETIGSAMASAVKPKEHWSFPKRLVSGRGGRQDMELARVWIEKFRAMWDHGVPNFCIGVSAYLYACEWLRPEKVILVGFDNFFDPSREYAKANVGKWRTGHDWTAEKAIADRIAAHYGVPYIQAEVAFDSSP